MNTAGIKDKLVLSICFLFVAILYFSCAKDKPIQGFEEIADSDKRGSINFQNLTRLDSEITNNDSTVATGLGLGLSIGAIDNIESQIIIRHQNVPASIDIGSVTLVLKPTTNLTDDMSQDSFQITAHEVIREWQEASVTYESLDNGFAPEVLGEALVPSSADSTVFESGIRIELNTTGVDLVRSWQTDSTGNNGFLLNFNNASFMAGFFARENIFTDVKPFVEIINTDSTQTDTIAVLADAYLPRQTREPVAGPLYVDNPFSWHTVVKFDLSGIPRESTINHASMIFNIDPDNTLRSNETFELQVYRLEEEYTSYTSVDFSSLLLLTPSPVVPTDSSRVVLAVQDLVSSWVNGFSDNHGLLIRSGQRGLDVSRVAFHSSSSDPELGPYIEMDWNVPPTEESSN